MRGYVELPLTKVGSAGGEWRLEEDPESSCGSAGFET